MYKVNPCERLHNKGNWFKTEVEEIYEEGELSDQLVGDLGDTEVLLESLVGDLGDVVIPAKGSKSRRRKLQVEGNNLN